MKAELMFREQKEENRPTVAKSWAGVARMIPQIDVEIRGTNPEVVLEIVSVVRAAMAARKEWEEQ